MESMKPSWRRWFNVIVLSLSAAVVCLILGRPFEVVIIGLAKLMNIFAWPAHFVLLSYAVGLLWFIVIKLGGARLSDLCSFSTLRYPPIWIPMLIGSGLYLCLRYYVCTSSTNGVSFEWRSLVWTVLAILAGIVFAGIYYRFPTHKQETRIAHGKTTAWEDPGDTFETLLRDPSRLMGWLTKETPITHPREDYFDLKQYACRIAGILRQPPFKTIAIAGPYGCGKSSILKMIDFYLYNNDQSDGSVKECLDNRHRHIEPERIITCLVSGWGFQGHKLAEYILSSAVKELSHHVDCVGLADLPSRYDAAISSSGSVWAKVLASFMRRSLDPMNVLRQMDSVLGSIDKRLVVYIEDLDRNLHDESFWGETISLLDRLKDLDHVSFIFAIGTPEKEVHADTLLRIAEHIEVVPPLAWHHLNTLIGGFREFCSQAFNRDVTFQAKEKADDRFGFYRGGGSEREQIVEMLNLFPNKPINAITDLVMTPRTAKAALRRTWQAWQTLHGEINLDDLLVGNFIRSVAPEIFTFLNQNIDRLRLLDRETGSEGQKERQAGEREALSKEYFTIADRSKINQEAMNFLIEFLFPGWKQNTFFRSDVPQAVALPPRPTNYWERLTKESLDTLEVSDQEILQQIETWKTNGGQETECLAANLLERPEFAEKMTQFGSIIDGHEVRRLAGQLFHLILSHNERRGKQQHYRGFLELWRLAMDRQVDEHEEWVLAQIRLALPISLRFANDIYFYWHNTEKSMITIDHPQPKLRNGVISAARATYGDKPEALVRAIEPGFHCCLFYLIIVYSQPRYGGSGLDLEDWSWLADPVLKAAATNPGVIIPELIGLAVRSGREGPDRLDLDTIDRLFTGRTPKVMQLLLTEFDESELDEQGRQNVQFARAQADSWLRESGGRASLNN
jgi:hypothetical protein